MKKQKSKTIEMIDERADELIKEFYKHFNDCEDISKDQRIVFEAWAIHKIAALQVVTELMSKGHEFK